MTRSVVSVKTLKGLLFYLAVVLACLGAASSSAVDSQVKDAGKLRNKAKGIEPFQIAQGPVSPPAPGVSNITQLTAGETKEGVSITLESSGSLQYTAFKLQNPLRLVMDFPKTRKGILQNPVTVGKGVVDSVRPLYFDEAEVLRLEITLNKAASYEIVRVAGNKLVVNLKEAPKETPAQAPAPATAKAPALAEKSPKPAGDKAAAEAASEKQEREAVFTEERCIVHFSGSKEPISMDFQNAQLSNIFRILAEVSGFNIVLAPSVQGTINVRMVDVPWNQALELIVKNNGLVKQCFEKNVRILPMESLVKEEETRAKAKLNRRLAVRDEALGADLETEIVVINYADLVGPNKNKPDPSTSELVKALTALKSERGQISADPRTNTVIISDIRPRLVEMINVIKAVDHPTQQVLIEARIVEVRHDVAQALGIQWGGTGTAITSKEFPSTIKVGPSTATNPGFVVDLGQTSKILPGAAAGIGLSLGSLAKDVVLDAQLTALETEGKLKILSSPKVTTMDNREAKIQSGSKIPYSTVSQDGTKIEFVDAALELLVTPHITSEKTVLMKIQAKKNSADFSHTVGGGVPTILTKEASTELLIRDGDTTVLGGLYENTVSRDDKRVPFLHQIPLLGNLFKGFFKEDIVNELLIFITPTVVKNL